MTEKQADYITEAMELLKGERQEVEFYSSGFTPAPDTLVRQYGITCAAVWGKIWRYCQMEEDICRAAQERLAEELNISRPTLDKYISILEKDGYIKDRTPDLRNKPHIFTDTGKLRLKINLSVTESTVKNFYSESKKFLLEESTTDKRNPYQVYEANMGPLTPMISDSIDDLVNTYSLNWFLDAVELAVHYNKRNIAYMTTILKRWQTEGKDDGKSKPKPTPEDARTAALRAQGYDV